MVLDVITEEIRDKSPGNIMFANDIALCGNTIEEVEKQTEDCRQVMEVNGKETEYMVFNEVSAKRISMQDFELKKVKHFKYLGSILSGNGDLNDKVENRIQAEWMKWRTLSGVLCDLRLSERTKGNVLQNCNYTSYDLWCRNLGKTDSRNEDQCHGNEMLRFACGHTRLGKYENKEIRKRMKVTEMQRKIQKKRL
jgi:hypothetical protein